jgi:hypothetical protein
MVRVSTRAMRRPILNIAASTYRQLFGRRTALGTSFLEVLDTLAVLMSTALNKSWYELRCVMEGRNFAAHKARLWLLGCQAFSA